MTEPSLPEVWLRGPLPDVPPLLQPVAHSLLQCREEIRATLMPLTGAQIVARPGGAASVGFHVRHAIGALDRLLTYARGEQLSELQSDALAHERDVGDESPHLGQRLISMYEAAVDRALEQVRNTSESTLREAREVGRGRLPSTVIGLLFHAAEHTQRHAGQAVTTAKVVRG
jgi:DinB family protein